MRSHKNRADFVGALQIEFMSANKQVPMVLEFSVPRPSRGFT